MKQPFTASTSTGALVIGEAASSIQLQQPSQPTTTTSTVITPPRGSTRSWNGSTAASSSSSSSPPPQTVILHLIQAMQDESLYDVELVSSSTNNNNNNNNSSSSTVLVPANRFVLAARSAVFRRMLYGSFREAQLTCSPIGLSYSTAVLQAVVHFCYHDRLPPCATTTIITPNTTAQLLQQQKQQQQQQLDQHHISFLIELTHAADYLQLAVLKELAEAQVLQLMAAHVSATTTCRVLQEALDGSRLELAALQMIECRPYAALMANSIHEEDPIQILSADKLEKILQNPAVGAGEEFLFGLLWRWYNPPPQPQSPSSARRSADRERWWLRQATRLGRHLRLSHMEPGHLLSSSTRMSGGVSACPWIERDRIFRAVADQALQASHDQVWRWQCRGEQRGVDRILVEHAGDNAVNGLYYRIARPGSSTSSTTSSTSSRLVSSNRSDLYSKREVACGQQYVYTLSRCRIAATPLADARQDGRQPEYYEFRIFASKFLTHRAVPSLVQMQSSAALVPYFQPVLQVLDLQPPADNADATSATSIPQYYPDATMVPTPIRKYYRLRLSDGDYHMPATLSDSFNAMMERRELREKNVLQVLEFGVYTVFGTVGIHVIRANVVTSTPVYIFGSPIPLEEWDATALPPVTDSTSTATGTTALQHLYRCTCPVNEHEEQHTAKIPSTGWQVDVHGIEPVPQCRWIPDSSSTASSGAPPPSPWRLPIRDTSTSVGFHSSSQPSRSRGTGSITDNDDSDEAIHVA